MFCEDTTDNTVTEYNLTEPANNGNLANPYGADGPLPYGDYDLLPRPTPGKILPQGSPVYTSPGRSAGAVTDPQGNTRGVPEPIGPHVGKRSKGCPLFPPTPEGNRQKAEFYNRFNNNLNNGGTSVTVH